jgi:hypothetical protein
MLFENGGVSFLQLYFTCALHNEDHDLSNLGSISMRLVYLFVYWLVPGITIYSIVFSAPGWTHTNPRFIHILKSSGTLHTPNLSLNF